MYLTWVKFSSTLLWWTHSVKKGHSRGASDRCTFSSGVSGLITNAAARVETHRKLNGLKDFFAHKEHSFWHFTERKSLKLSSKRLGFFLWCRRKMLKKQNNEATTRKVFFYSEHSCRGRDSWSGNSSWIKVPQERCNWTDVSSNPSCDIGVRKKPSCAIYEANIEFGE